MNMNSPARRFGPKSRIAVALVAVAAVGAILIAGRGNSPEPEPAAATKPADKAPGKAALTVTLTAPQILPWAQTLSATGSVFAWQEAIIGPEISNYRITEVRAQVGEQVKKGQVLARIATDTVASEQAEARASVAELEATAAEAKANAERARELRAQGFYSSQLNNQYQTAEHTALARLAAARARQQAADLKMSKTSVLAPDDGVISVRSATVGSLTQSGQELFRLIRGGRLEWRAEVPSADLAKIRPGMPALLTNPNGESVKGVVRSVAPSVDPQTRNGLVYVDLPAGSAIRAGMFARGEFELGQTPALTLPQSAVVLREGFAYAFRLEDQAGDGGHVAQSKLSLGRQQGERIEVLRGLDAKARVVESGVGFLADGDSVKIVEGGTKP